MTITMTRPSNDAAAAVPAGTGFCVTVNPSGRLSIMDAARLATTVAALARRSIGGTVYRVALTAGITAWLDGDEQDGSGELNWAATQMCAALSGAAFTGPADIPFVCGPVLFTTPASGLSGRQVALLAQTHAAVEHPDTVPVGMADTRDWDR